METKDERTAPDAGIPPFGIMLFAVLFVLASAMLAVVIVNALFFDELLIDFSVFVYAYWGLCLMRGGFKSWVVLKWFLAFAAVAMVADGVYSAVAGGLAGEWWIGPAIGVALGAGWWSVACGESARWMANGPHDNAPVARRIFWPVFLVGVLIGLRWIGVERDMDNVYAANVEIFAVDARTGAEVQEFTVSEVAARSRWHSVGLEKLIPHDFTFAKDYGGRAYWRIKGVANYDRRYMVTAPGYHPAGFTVNGKTPDRLTVKLEPLPASPGGE